jgi:hypothetical protein
MTERWHFTIGWLVWIALFFVLEAWAVFGDAPRATFSNHLRDWLKHQPTWVWTLALIFMLALTWHFLADLKDK